MTEKTIDPIITELLIANETLVLKWAKVTHSILLGIISLHITFVAFLIVSRPSNNVFEVTQFIAFNATILLAEMIVARLGLMLGARGGQLREVRIAILAASQPLDPTKFEAIARALMSLRRDPRDFKLLDVEGCLASLGNNKK